ncbi:hypothetical protein [Mucilaginibacter lacusdianchii]|uniref:hypothetical protein n=1 Tax=Mucilaginibacter lacusdianchii TaxID=2684211 RepID=UPI00131A8933|nr:hypothetical protein [Mucilaginibacter sp. JXJ CY 39]
MEQLRMFGTSNQKMPVTAKEYGLMFLLLATSGNPFFTQNLPIVITLVSAFSLYYILSHYNQKIYHRTFLIFVFFMGYEVLHAIMFHLDYSVTIVKLFLIMLFGFAVVNTLKKRFVPVFIQTMYVISIISFVFTVLVYIPGLGRALYNIAEQLFPLKKDFKNYSTPTLLLYTFLPEFFDGRFTYARNAGIFWESGAFAVYLNVVLYLHYYTKTIVGYKDLIDKKSVVFVIAILTTASTMGFLSLIVVLTVYALQFKSNLKYLFVVLVFLASALAFNSFDFLGAKISEQLAVSGVDNNRFGSALMDWHDIMQRPILGWSRRIEVLFGTTVSSARSHRPNGLTNFLRNYGFLYFTVYFYLVYASFKSIGTYYKISRASMAILGVLLLWIVSFSEMIFDEAFFKSLLFLYMVYLPASVPTVSYVRPKGSITLKQLQSVIGQNAHE